MPFPVKITITETFYKKGHYSNETTGFTASQFVGKEKPYEIKLGAFEVLGESHSYGLNMSRSGEFIFEYLIGEKTITHSIMIQN